MKATMNRSCRWLPWLGLLLLGFPGGPSALAADGTAPVKVPATSTAPVADPFQRLRRAVLGPQPDYWYRVNEALQQLATLEGAAYNPRYGVLTLHGKPAQGQGPFHLDDLMVALKAVYFEPDDVGMTIDPRPDNPQGPEMDVVFFGGCENTACGWFLFECDRLLKSLSHGEDNLTGQPLRPARPDDFFNMLELARGFREQIGDEWNRFWLTTDLEEGPSWREKPRQSNGTQPVLLLTEDGTAVSFRHCRLYLRTEVMALQGGKMVPVKDGKSKAAQRFAAHFTNHFDVYAEQYPVFARAAALARLVVLAEWLDWLGERANVSLDTEFIRHYRQQVPVRTPTRTPAKTVSLSWQEAVPNGIAEHVIQCYGGVDLKPRAFFADDQDGAAAKQRDLSNGGLQTHPSDVTWMDRVEGDVYRVAVIPTPHTQLRRPQTRSPDQIAFDDPAQSKQPPDGHLPRAPLLGGEDRAEDVTTVPISTETIDQLRLQKARGPPDASGYAILVDDRSFAGEDRGESVDPLPQPVRPKTSSIPNMIRGPPESPGTEPQSDRSESVDTVPVRPGSHASLSHRSTLLPRPEGPPEERLAISPPAPAAPSGGPAPDRLGLPIFTAPDGSKTYNLPRLCEPVGPRQNLRAGIAGRPETYIRVIPHLTVMSELGDILIDFQEPQIDQARGAMYYPPTPASSAALQVTGYYPQNRTLEFRDGMRIVFREDGNPGEAFLPNGTLLRFRYATSSPDLNSWPRPIACEVRSAGDGIGSGVYRLVATADPNARSQTPPPSTPTTPPTTPPPTPPPTPPSPSTPPTTPPSPSTPPTTPPSSRTPASPPSAPSSVPPSASPTQPAPSSGPEWPADKMPSEKRQPDVTPPTTPPVPAVSSDVVPPQVPSAPSEPRVSGSGSPIHFDPEPGRLNRLAISPALQVGQSMTIDQPFSFGSNAAHGPWKALLRAARTPPEAHNDSSWSGDDLLWSGPDGSVVRLSLDQSQGEFEPGRDVALRLVATRVPASEGAAAVAPLQFYLDVEAGWQDAPGSGRKQASFPIELSSHAGGSGLLIVGLVVLLGLPAAAIVVLALRR